MKCYARFAAVGLLIAVVGTSIACAAATTASKAPAASRYYPFVGHWKGRGQLSAPGQPPTPLTLRLTCYKAASGWAVRCAMVAENGKMKMTESDLMGVDPVTGTGHWYAVTNQGDTHDHITDWPNAKTMKAHHNWTQNGKKMTEHISVSFSSRQSMKFLSVVTEDGKTASEFSGELTR